MVVDLKLKGMAGKRGLMFVTYYGKSRAFISNYSTWRQYNSYGKIVELASSLLSHESLHLTLNKFSLSASAKLDNLFGRSNLWENYPHGLGDLDRFKHTITTKTKNGQKIERLKTRKVRRTKNLPQGNT
ncbi:hypothetical protein [Nitrososphaera sp. AFS]|uniref:hypothetical protein n=1 Tax=Nitrososphaera sp. AFS TaxID=2301191 RepID=UPI00139237BB|nr:hypothetical protein [Nitrososphaera sp. AFS]NAL77224.1 hypothetical protein [Nitrososphaera sp. AFS]